MNTEHEEILTILQDSTHVQLCKLLDRLYGYYYHWN